MDMGRPQDGERQAGSKVQPQCGLSMENLPAGALTKVVPEVDSFPNARFDDVTEGVVIIVSNRQEPD